MSVLKIYDFSPQHYHIATVAIDKRGDVVCELLRDPQTCKFIIPRNKASSINQSTRFAVELADPTSIGQIVEWLRNKGLTDEKQHKND